MGGSAVLDTFARARPGSLKRRLYTDKICTEPRFTRKSYDELLAGVQFSPDGLRFVKPAYVTIELPAEIEVDLHRGRRGTARRRRGR